MHVRCPLLWTGARVGHRSLMRYYKQRFGLSRTVAVAKNKKAVGRVLQQYRALGWTSQTGKWQCEGWAEVEFLGCHHSTLTQVEFVSRLWGFVQWLVSCSVPFHSWHPSRKSYRRLFVSEIHCSFCASPSVH